MQPGLPDASCHGHRRPVTKPHQTCRSDDRSRFRRLQIPDFSAFEQEIAVWQKRDGGPILRSRETVDRWSGKGFQPVICGKMSAGQPACARQELPGGSEILCLAAEKMPPGAEVPRPALKKAPASPVRARRLRRATAINRQSPGVGEIRPAPGSPQRVTLV